MCPRTLSASDPPPEIPTRLLQLWEMQGRSDSLYEEAFPQQATLVNSDNLVIPNLKALGSVKW